MDREGMVFLLHQKLSQIIIAEKLRVEDENINNPDTLLLLAKDARKAGQNRRALNIVESAFVLRQDPCRHI